MRAEIWKSGKDWELTIDGCQAFIGTKAACKAHAKKLGAKPWNY